MSQAGLTCGDCLTHPPPWSGLTCAVDYGFPWDRLIIDLKFHARTELAGALSQRLTEAVRQADAADAVDLVLPVPLSDARLAERGFNQAWEVARRVAGDLALRADHSLLQRPVDTPHQADLPRDERARNLRGALMVDPRRRGRVQGRHLALVDDVFTTGATAREATQALLRAGAASVRVWAIARTL